MLVCKNDPKSKYAGTEPSPKGYGYCAHAEKIGTERRGRDQNMWVVKNYSGVKRWVRSNGVCVVGTDNKMHDKLYDKMAKEWWQNLSNGAIIIVYNDNTYELYISNKKTFAAANRDVGLEWIYADSDPTVKAIIWSTRSIDSLYHFVKTICKNKKLANELSSAKYTLDILLANPKKYFTKYPYIGSKDYVV